MGEEKVIEEVTKENLREKTEKNIRAAYFNMSKLYTASAKKLLLLMTAMDILTAASVALITLTVFKFNIAEAMIDRLCLVVFIAMFPMLMPNIFYMLRNKPEEAEYPPSFYLKVMAAMVCAVAVVTAAGPASIPFLAIPLFFKTVREDRREAFLGVARKGRACLDKAEHFHLTEWKMERILDGEEFVAEDDMFRIKVLKKVVRDETEE